jgi:hypothetical protein
VGAHFVSHLSGIGRIGLRGPVCHITSPGEPPFFTPYFDAENHFVDGMTVYDLFARLYTTDGETWKPINEDVL